MSAVRVALLLAGVIQIIIVFTHLEGNRLSAQALSLKGCLAKTERYSGVHKQHNYRASKYHEVGPRRSIPLTFPTKIGLLILTC